MGLPLEGMTEITLADSSKQIHLTALAKATLLGVTEIGIVILSPSSPEILVGMDFLRRFNRALVVVDQIDVERILARNTAARRDPHAQLCNRSGKLFPAGGATLRRNARRIRFLAICCQVAHSAERTCRRTTLRARQGFAWIPSGTRFRTGKAVRRPRLSRRCVREHVTEQHRVPSFCAAPATAQRDAGCRQDCSIRAGR